jgi:hypothetical protein
MEGNEGSKTAVEPHATLEVAGEEPESIASSILAKGRLTVWIILVGGFVSAAAGVLTGDQLLDIVKFIGGLWLGGELGARKP